MIEIRIINGLYGLFDVGSKQQIIKPIYEYIACYNIYERNSCYTLYDKFSVQYKNKYYRQCIIRNNKFYKKVLNKGII